VAAHPSRRRLRRLLGMRRFGRADSRLAKRTVGRSLNSRCQTAQSSSVPRRVYASGFAFLSLLCRPSLSPPPLRRSGRSFVGQSRCHLGHTTHSVTPNEGWMERRQAHSFSFVARARRDLRALRRGLSRSERDLSRRSTVAIFRPGTGADLSGSATGADQRSARAGPQARPAGSRASRGNGSRRSRGTPLPAPIFRIVSGDAPHERGCESSIINSLRSQYCS
jgi:hypothetical protein